MAKKIKRKIIGYTLACFMLLVVLFSILIRLPSFQTYLTHQVVHILSNKLGTTVKIDNVHFNLYTRLELNNIYIEDDHHDTLLFVRHTEVSLGYLSFFNKNISVKKMSLEDMKLFVSKDKHKKINFAMILDRLKSSPKKVKSPVVPDKRQPWQFDFHDLEISNFLIKYNDNFTNGHLEVFLPTGLIALNKLDLANKKIEINKAQLSKINISYNKGLEDIVDTSSHNIHFLGDMLLTYRHIDINDGHLDYNDNRKTKDTLGMDYFHLNVKNIEIHVVDGKVDHDTIFGRVNQLSCSEKCGFKIEQMTSDARVSTSDITLSKLKLKTENSLVKDYLRFSYDSFPDFKHFITNVHIQSSLNKSDISMKDINYFSKGTLTKIAHNHIWISGQIDGTLDMLKGKNIELKAGLKTEFNGKFTLEGLPKFKETLISATVKYAVTDITDIKRIYPSLAIPSFLDKLGKIEYNGKFDGFALDFVADGNFSTDIGRIDADLNFKLPPNSPPIYSGHLITDKFNIGKLFSQEENLGTISMDANIKGAGVQLSQLNTDFTGKVKQIHVKGYNYKDIDLDGEFKKKLFTGNLKIEDDNLDLTFTGSVSFDSILPQFNFTADVKKADLQALHLFNKKLIISTYSSIHFVGKKLDDFNGGIALKDLTLTTDSGTFDVSHLIVNAEKNAMGIKTLTLESSLANGNITGVFAFVQLPQILKNYINHYSIQPNAANVPAVGYAQFDFNFVIIKPSGLTKLINNNFNLISNSSVNGTFDSRKNSLALTLQIPELIFGRLKFKNIELNANSSESSFTIASSLKQLYNKDSLLISNTKFNANWRTDKCFDFDAFTGSLDSSYSADLHGKIGTDFNKIEASLENSSLLINRRKWSFEPENQIVFSNRYLNTQNIILKQDEKEVYVTTIHPNANTTNLEIDLSNISVNDFSKIFDKSKNNYFGKADGGFEVHDLFGKPTYFSNLNIANLGVNKDTIGNLSVSMEVEDFKTKIPVNAKLKGKFNDIEAKGTYTPGKDANNIDIDININRFKIDVINNYLSQYVTKASGYALGQLKISGTDKKPQLTGFINLVKCEATVAYINTHYRLDNEIIKFKENEFRLDNIVLRDDNNGTAIAGGSIKHTNLKNFFFDLYITTDYFQMLRTTQKENPIYWGTINLTSATALFQGPIKNISIKVNGATAKNSTITIPIRTTAETDKYSFYKFINKSDTGLLIPKSLNAKSLLDVSIDLDVTEDAEMTLILDPVSGDRITTRGNGNIRVGYNDLGGLKVQGDYTISTGNYFFTLQNIINKYFTIDKGSRITFDGNIYDAMLDVSAVYSIRTAPYDLIADRIIDDPELKTIANKRIPTKLILLLNGPMQQPKIDFNVKIDNVDPRIQSIVDTKVADLKNDKNQLNKQAASLLVMNSFYPAGLGTGALISGGATSTFSELLSTQISNLVSRFIGNFLQGFDIRIEYKPYSQEGSSGNDIYVGVRQGVGQRLVLNAGGNINVTNKSSDKNQNQYNVDFSADYQVTKDGRIKLKAYNKTSVGTITSALYTTSGNTNSTGLGLSYREEFDDFNDLRKQWKERRERRRDKKKLSNFTPPNAVLPKNEESHQ